jgi:quercetin dioxygenase-like cupin family protein
LPSESIFTIRVNLQFVVSLFVRKFFFVLDRAILEENMTLPKISACAAFVASVGFAAFPAFAENMVTPALKTMIEGMPNTEANIVSFDVEPGWVTDHHIHPGHVFVYVIEGALHIDVDGKDPVDYTAGSAFYELPNVGMTGGNLSATDRAKFIVFQFGEAGKQLMVAD